MVASFAAKDALLGLKIHKISNEGGSTYLLGVPQAKLTRFFKKDTCINYTIKKIQQATLIL